MQLRSDSAPADLHLTLVTEDASLDPAAARVATTLKDGEVTLVRGESRDVALALPPLDVSAARALGVKIARLAKDVRATSVSTDEFNPEFAPAFAIGVTLGAYRFTKFKSDDAPVLSSVSVGGLTDELAERIVAVASGVNLARDLVNRPLNDLTPKDFTREAHKLADEFGLELEVWGRAECEVRGMRLFLAVNEGSAHEPQFIQLTYKPQHATRVIALVGKSVMFDTGGYSIKTSAGMATMKCDMGGGAAVLGAMRALALLKPDVEVRAYLPACDNAISGAAMRPGDVFRAANGKTVEVTNTDAEGRLTLADALTIACDEGADLVVDLATLTGAKVVALGDDLAALFTSDAAVEFELREAAARADEGMWPMPLHSAYLKGYKKGPADLKNSDLKPSGGAIKAALFLREFVTKPWAHLDIAGCAFAEGEHDLGPSGGTGYGVMTLVELVAPTTALS
ncbi:leucyl aminopeptidase family protein [Deinococcus yavapaiensis]|uniref:Leucyl aminopeptidase n=1 Tax=Deinococcus yavapaiensis KR-236 TaxID=694435 RepID=A0A318SBD0_9DEIO|nr:leucyl aminopeptidase family protein [Deinococcus yavapaiensis]PYE56358.1 leucyl aminopeptidase [Deinococcus yavapaiensis KR-236]